MANFNYTDIAKMIDHALLVPTLTEAELDQGCRLAVAYDVASVCIMPYYAARCTELLSGSTVKSSTTIGFPHGGQSTATKAFEAEQAISDGCQELDMVVNISKVRSGDWDYVRDDIRAVKDVTSDAGRQLKVIFENCYLDDEEKIQLCELCGELHAEWVKTSTGFGSGGATAEDLKLMRRYAPGHVQVKAAGGIRTYETLMEYRALGVTRVGASQTAAILDECRRHLNLPPIQFDAIKQGTGY